MMAKPAPRRNHGCTRPRVPPMRTASDAGFRQELPESFAYLPDRPPDLRRLLYSQQKFTSYVALRAERLDVRPMWFC